ncbi:hypothetical protein BGZ60DRAFT_435406 [Tricladium varicosporioides]|nr:hypothetical protein BGZ60DRAFT_435406 [Hymenoscyphus varicosporioides]
MAPHVTSKTLKTLFAELGFEDDKFPGRDQRDIRKALAKVPIKPLTLGNPALFWNINSDKAKGLAYEFCQGSQRAKTLWPYSPGKGWPAWSSDETKIIQLLAHVLCLKAYYKYHHQREGTNEKAQDSEEKEDSVGAMDQRELSPESRVFSTPAPPSGTKKRPSKRSYTRFLDAEDHITSESFDQAVPSTFTNVRVSPSVESVKLYKSHIVSLAPACRISPLTSFSKKWLESCEEESPSKADPQLLMYMHENNMYDPEAKDRKVIKLIEELLAGSELENRDAFQYNTIEARVLNRITKLSKQLFDDGFVVSGPNGKFGKSEAFAEYWDKKNSFWDMEQSTAKGNTSYRATLPPSHDNVRKALSPLTTGKSSIVKPSRRSAKSTSEILPGIKPLKDLPSSSPTTSKTLDLTIENEEGPHSPKRAKQTFSRNDERGSSLPIPSRSGETFPCSVEGDQDNNASEISNGADEGSRTALLTQSNPTLADIVSQTYDERPITLPPHLEQSIQFSRIMTPISPTPTTGALRHENILFRTPPPSSYNNTSSSQLLNLASSTSVSEAEIFLTTRDKSGNYNSDNPIFASRLRNCSLKNLFDMVSEHSGVPYDSISCLTFRSVFATGFSTNLMDLLEKDGQEETWHELKRKMRRRYRHVKNTKPEHDDFEVLVDIGNTTNVIWGNVHAGGF